MNVLSQSLYYSLKKQFNTRMKTPMKRPKVLKVRGKEKFNKNKNLNPAGQTQKVQVAVYSFENNPAAPRHLPILFSFFNSPSELRKNLFKISLTIQIYLLRMLIEHSCT